MGRITRHTITVSDRVCISTEGGASTVGDSAAGSCPNRREGPRNGGRGPSRTRTHYPPPSATPPPAPQASLQPSEPSTRHSVVESADVPAAMARQRKHPNQLLRFGLQRGPRSSPLR